MQTLPRYLSARRVTGGLPERTPRSEASGFLGMPLTKGALHIPGAVQFHALDFFHCTFGKVRYSRARYGESAHI